MFSIFEKRSTAPGTLQWLPNLGLNCLHGMHLVPKSSSKVAMFDVDGTLITPTGGRRHPKDAEDWQWWNPRVKNKLNDIAKEGSGLLARAKNRMADWTRRSDFPSSLSPTKVDLKARTELSRRPNGKRNY